MKDVSFVGPEGFGDSFSRDVVEVVLLGEEVDIGSIGREGFLSTALPHFLRVEGSLLIDGCVVDVVDFLGAVVCTWEDGVNGACSVEELEGDAFEFHVTELFADGKPWFGRSGTGGDGASEVLGMFCGEMDGVGFNAVDVVDAVGKMSYVIF